MVAALCSGGSAATGRRTRECKCPRPPLAFQIHPATLALRPQAHREVGENPTRTRRCNGQLFLRIDSCATASRTVLVGRLIRIVLSQKTGLRA